MANRRTSGWLEKGSALRLTRSAAFFPRFIQRGMAKFMYNTLSKHYSTPDWMFMNFGYADIQEDTEPLMLSDEDEKNRYCIQLYHHVAAQISLDGLNVLEVGCGRGGGSNYVKRALNPKTMTGVDLSNKAIDFCSSFYKEEGLSFMEANAESLPFEDASFDAVLNVESAHCYSNLPGFFDEVKRVLTPGGHFLFTDRLYKEGVPLLRRQLDDTGMKMLKDEDITPNILAALDIEHERKYELLNKNVPRWARKSAMNVAAVKGTSVYDDFMSGKILYLCFALRKE